MNWDNQNKDPWGGKNDAPDFDELVKKFSSILGGKNHHQMVRVAVQVEALKFQLQDYFCMHFLDS